jgi:hypothetical protein
MHLLLSLLNDTYSMHTIIIIKSQCILVGSSSSSAVGVPLKGKKEKKKKGKKHWNTSTHIHISTCSTKKKDTKLRLRYVSWNKQIWEKYNIIYYKAKNILPSFWLLICLRLFFCSIIVLAWHFYPRLSPFYILLEINTLRKLHRFQVLSWEWRTSLVTYTSRVPDVGSRNKSRFEIDYHFHLLQ